MILYLDTSSLLKLFLEEADSDVVHGWADQAEVLATSRVAYPEAMAALGRRWREKDLDDETFGVIREAVAKQWEDFSVLDLNEKSAGSLAIEHGLRGFDAVHLAAALDLRSSAGTAQMSFSSFDTRLNKAAEAEKLPVLVP